MSWWIEPIRRWAAALAVEYRIERVPSIASRDARTWFKEKQDWCLQITSDTYVRFIEWKSSTELRDALTWTIFLNAPEEVIFDEAEELLQRFNSMTLPELSAQLDAKRNIFGEAADKWLYPGYLYVIDGAPERAQPYSTVDETDATLWYHAIPDVLEATIQSFWHVVLRQQQTVVVYVSTAQLSMAIEDLPDINVDNFDVLRLPHVRRVAEFIGTAITEDVLFNARVSVSKRLQSATDVEGALASAVLIRRMTQSSTSKVAVFGEMPLEFLTSQADERTRTAFWTMTTERAQKALIEWPEEWLEMVEGLIKANLNVSEAARLLYVHRNTLISRIERLYQVTGFDVRNVQDALVLYLAGMLTRQQPAPEIE